MTPAVQSLWALHIAALLFGGTALFSRIIPLPATDITVLRSVIASVALLALLAVTDKRIRLFSLRDYGIALLLGAIIGVHWATYFAAMQLAGIAIGMIALFTFPVITVFLEPLFDGTRGQRPAPADLLMALLVILGVGLLVPTPSLGSEITLGILSGVFSALLYACRNILAKRYFSHYSGPQAMFYQTLVAAILLSPFLVSSVEQIPHASWGWLILLAVVFTATPHALVAESLRNLKAKTVGLVSCLQPLYGTLLAAWLLAELPTATTLLGGSLVLFAAFWETWRVRRR